MLRRALVLLVLAAPAAAQDKKFVMEPGPKSPAESLKCIKVRPGFKVELMACEPAVMDPIAFAWGADGKLWAVEMGDYPLGVDAKGKHGGRVKFLEKTKPDGLYDKATVFLDNLGYPTGVFPWRKGVLITCAPDILYAEDAKGTGKADKVVKLYSGFREGNQQHRVNGLSWGLDNWIYGANGDSGGSIKSYKHGEKDKPVDINGRDFRIKPDTGEIEAVTGQSQFGRCRDDWGNWFGCNNSNPMYHFVLEDRYLKRNPTLLFTDVRSNVSEQPGAAQVFPISKPLPRFNTPAGLNHFTSACSVMIYRDDLFGPEFEGNSFVSEPVHNLVHREVMRHDGLTFRSRRADDEKESEFLASSDNWFRPTTIQTGPDGAIWIADMYRYVIEHPEWIPKEWQAKLDLRAGHDKGRIYRVYPEKKKPRAIPDLAKLNGKELVKALDSPSGWQRDMAHMLLTRKGMERVVVPLQEMVAKAKRPQARLHALMAFEKVDDVAPLGTLEKALADSHSAIRKHALLCLEGRTIAGIAGDASLIGLLLNDPDEKVQLQMAYLLGELSHLGVAKLLVAHAEKVRKDKRLLAACLSSINETTYDSFLRFCETAPERGIPEEIVRGVLLYGLTQGKPIEPHLVVRTVAAKVTTENMTTLAAVCDSLEARRSSLAEALAGAAKKPAYPEVSRKLEPVFAHARTVTDDVKAPLAERMIATRLLGRGPSRHAEDLRRLEKLLIPATPDELQQVILSHLVKVGDDNTPSVLLVHWKSFTPTLRMQAFDTLTARRDWTLITMLGLESKKILPGELDAARRQRLFNHPDSDLRLKAARIFGAGTSADRDKALRKYTLALTLEGDAKKGAPVFKRVCAACHRLGDVGQDVGPELASVGDRTPEGLLTAILDPNRAVESRYLNYLATTKAGVTHTGILASETSTSITLVGVDGKKQDVLRADLDELICTGKSAMPEGLEKDITLPEMADLLRYLSTYLPPKMSKD
jgi:putative membrane-bound dehydrogenase-like protein